jgi:hypothetical protein
VAGLRPVRVVPKRAVAWVLRPELESCRAGGPHRGRECPTAELRVENLFFGQSVAAMLASESALESAGVGGDGVPHIMIHCAQLHAAGPPGPEPGVAYTPSQFVQACSRGRAREQNGLRAVLDDAQDPGPPYIATITGALRDSPVAALETARQHRLRGLGLLGEPLVSCDKDGVWAKNLATANGRAQPPASMQVRDLSTHEEDGRAAR